MKYNPLPPLEELKEYLDYNSDTGVFIWKKRPAYRIKIGQQAGCLNSEGYRMIKLKRSIYLSHRIAYYMYHGVDPLEKQVDHINGNKADDRIKNLRLATCQENNFNKGLRRNNTSGFTGVHWRRGRQKWIATVQLRGNYKYLGIFNEKEDAIQARIEAEKKYFGEFRADSQIDCES
tara:strand:+ start:775 stop:1302 length:528 start_codon:yes stop_codon:yes gene_type:complete